VIQGIGELKMSSLKLKVKRYYIYYFKFRLKKTSLRVLPLLPPLKLGAMMMI
jgi:hypothetical protein